MDNDKGTLRGLRDLLRKRAEMGKVQKSSGTATGFAQGGQVEDELAMNPLLQGQPPVAPPLNEVAASLNQTPDTNYDFYKELDADQRKALYDQISQRQRGPGAMISQGLAGVGDAISNSYGGQKNTFQKDVMANQKAQGDAELGAFDTQRSQRMGDASANTEMANNDPKSPLSKSMQEILRSKGIQVPSGMSAGMLIKIMGPLGDMAAKEASQILAGAQLKETKDQNAFSRNLATDKLAADQAAAAAAAKDKESQNRFDAAKGLNNRSTLAKVGDFFSKSDATKEMENQLGTPAEAPSALSYQDPDKEARYQAWKASQGK